MTKLCRADLEADLYRTLHSSAGLAHRVLSNEELDASVDALLAEIGPDADPWVFGYGSLVWNPIMNFAERRLATLSGYHRRFCLWSHIGRGTKEFPGLVLGLDRGGCCRGVSYRLPHYLAREELRLLWRREMAVGAYVPRWIRVVDETGGGEHRAIAFVVNRKHPSYTGKLARDPMIKALSGARGQVGSSADYLMHTVESLITHGIRDEHLIELQRCVLAEMQAAKA
jgi:cation transport protein ChaC